MGARVTFTDIIAEYVELARRIRRIREIKVEWLFALCSLAAAHLVARAFE